MAEFPYLPSFSPATPEQLGYNGLIRAAALLRTQGDIADGLGSASSAGVVERQRTETDKVRVLFQCMAERKHGTTAAWLFDEKSVLQMEGEYNLNTTTLPIDDVMDVMAIVHKDWMRENVYGEEPVCLRERLRPLAKRTCRLAWNLGDLEVSRDNFTDVFALVLSGRVDRKDLSNSLVGELVVVADSVFDSITSTTEKVRWASWDDFRLGMGTSFVSSPHNHHWTVLSSIAISPSRLQPACGHNDASTVACAASQSLDLWH